MEAKQQWAEELSRLNAILQKSGLTATIKWGVDVYTHLGVNVVGVAGFKSFFTLWFYNGVFLEDKHQVLIRSDGGNAKALRQWRFHSMEDINEDLILEYVREAAANSEKGLVWKPQKSAPAEIPELLAHALKGDTNLAAAFETLIPSKQKEYIEHITSAKKEETKRARLEKIIPMILNGIGLHDKYKNC
jgi:uncharacterized protein YdeI (YjbR/CyaY-like superfamily)